MDAATGELVAKRQVRSRLFRGFVPDLVWSSRFQQPAPFNSTDLPYCPDIQGAVGITGTPVIDRSTNTMYLFAKGYKSSARGFTNGAYVSEFCREVML